MFFYAKRGYFSTAIFQLFVKNLPFNYMWDMFYSLDINIYFYNNKQINRSQVFFFTLIVIFKDMYKSWILCLKLFATEEKINAILMSKEAEINR